MNPLSTLVPRRLAAALALAAAVSIPVFVASAGAAESGIQLPGVNIGGDANVSLGPITITGNVAVVTGSVDGTPTNTGASAAVNVGLGSSSANVGVNVNGKPASVDGNGDFQATVNLGGEDSVDVSATNATTGENFTVSVPTGLAGSDGVINGALDQLDQAKISLNLPPGGFQTLDNQPVDVSLGVGNPSKLAALTVNGASALGANGANGANGTNGSSGANGGSGANGSTGSKVAPKPTRHRIFSVPGTSSTVTIAATDQRGVSQTSNFPVTSISSVIRTNVGQSVAAAGASGLRISRVRYDTRGAQQTRKMHMTVTVRDLRGYLVRDAIVQVHGVRGVKPTLTGQQSRFSSDVGTATFTLGLRPSLSLKRLFVGVNAHTPTATAQRISSVVVPKL